MSSYVDVSVIGSVVGGLLVAVVAAWAWLLYARLEQAWLEHAAGEALDAALARGLRLRPTGFRARLIAHGDDGLRVVWRTGLLGPRTVIVQRGQRRPLPLVRTRAELDQALG